MFELTCNLCGAAFSQSGSFRTKCNHILCESCACGAFNKGCLCPVCGYKLHDGEVKELIVGICPTSLSDALYQNAFQQSDWVSILDNSIHVVSATLELLIFVQSQLFLRANILESQSADVAKDLNALRSDKVSAILLTWDLLTETLQEKLTMQLRNEMSVSKQRVRELEAHMQIREKELCDMKEAFAEKSKKCDAWEKAYGNLRAQFDIGDQNISRWPAMRDTEHKDIRSPTKCVMPSAHIKSFPQLFKRQEKVTYRYSEDTMDASANVSSFRGARKKRPHTPSFVTNFSIASPSPQSIKSAINTNFAPQEKRSRFFESTGGRCNFFSK